MFLLSNESCFEVGKHLRVIQFGIERMESTLRIICVLFKFKSDCILVMVWGTFNGYEKSSIDIIHSNRWITIDLVNIVYEGTLSSFYFFHDHLEDLFFMELIAPVHHCLPHLWRKSHGQKRLNWPPNCPNITP
jgi:hypothetical protein